MLRGPRAGAGTCVDVTVRLAGAGDHFLRYNVIRPSVFVTVFMKLDKPRTGTVWLSRTSDAQGAAEMARHGNFAKEDTENASLQSADTRSNHYRKSIVQIVAAQWETASNMERGSRVEREKYEVKTEGRGLKRNRRKEICFSLR